MFYMEQKELKMSLKIVKPKKPMSLERAVAIIEKAMRYHLHCAYGDEVGFYEHDRDKEAWKIIRLSMSYLVDQKQLEKHLKSKKDEDGGGFDV